MSAIVSVKNVSKIYEMGEVKIKALDGVSLEINQGDFLIITGRSGSGKSTLLRQIGLLDRPDGGQIFFYNKEVSKVKEKERIRIRLNQIGYIFQEYALIGELTALDNVMLPAMMIESRKACRQKALDLLEMVELKHRIKNLPSQLSGGEQQRVAIARALINNPAVIFADEPTANLDTISANQVLDIFKKLNQEGHTIVMITHEPEEEKAASRVIRLSDGRIRD